MALIFTDLVSGQNFCKRLALHVLPRGLARIRYAGLFAVAHRKTLLPLNRKLLGEKRAAEEEAMGAETETLFAEVEEASVHEADQDYRCHKCQGRVELHETLSPTLTVAIMAIAQWMIAWRNEKISAAETWTPTLAVLHRILTVQVARGSRNTVTLSLMRELNGASSFGNPVQHHEREPRSGGRLVAWGQRTSDSEARVTPGE